MTSGQGVRHADLTGKAVVVAGESPLLVAIVRALARNGMLIAVAAPDRSVVRRAVGVAEELDASVLGITADPSEPMVWERTAPQVEQRLGPIDVAVAIGPATLRDAVRAAVVQDMIARQRGVVIEVHDRIDDISGFGSSVRRYGIRTGGATADEIANAVVDCASDTKSEPVATIEWPSTAGPGRAPD